MSIFGALLRSAFGKEVGKLANDTLGTIIGHLLVNKLNVQGQPILVGDEPVKILDPEKLRTHAPHFAKTIEEVATFNGYILDLDPGSQKTLEVWMATLGMHQRADIIIKIVALGRPDRTCAVKKLTQLSEIMTDAERNTHVVAFRLMKPAESDYLGAQLHTWAATTLTAALDDLTQLRLWMDADARVAQTSADQIFAETRQMNNEPWYWRVWLGLTSPLRF